MRGDVWGLLTALLLLLAGSGRGFAAGPKVHTVALGAVRKSAYTPAEATAETKADETSTLKVRPLIVDGRQKEWTTGEAHDVTDRSYVVRRALHINDTLPGEGSAHWVWQPGPWLMVDRVSGHVTALHLPDFDAEVSEVVWFRDYAAYCGVSTAAKGGLVAVVAQLGARKAVTVKPLAKWPMPEHEGAACAAAKWQRLPMRATLQMAGGQPMTIDVMGSSSLVEEADNDED